MFLFDVEARQKVTMLRAMRSVALADGEETPRERALLEVCRDALGLDGALDGFAPLEASDPVLDALEPRDGERLIQSMILMAVMDGAGAASEAELVSRFAEKLGIHDARIQNLRQLADGRIRWMRFDLTRKGYARTELAKTAQEEGLAGIYRTFGPLVGLAKDPDLARRYIALGELPAGTLGRGYFDLITKNDLSFPGEAGGIAERGLWHDLIHVVGGYGVDPVGEAQVVAFMAGFRKEDPFFWLFTVALQFQVGLAISPFAPGVPDKIDPRTFVLHHKRGSLVQVDLSQDWRFEAEWDQPLDDVRRRLGVVPLEAVTL